VLNSIGDNRGQPFLGPGKIKFLDVSTLGVIDKSQGFHVVSVNGIIATSISPTRPFDKRDDPLTGNRMKHKLSDSSDGSENGNSVEEDEDEASTKYLNILFCDFCRVPLTRNLAICDQNTDTIKIVNRDDWTIDRSLGQPNLQAAPIFSQLSCIDSFQIHFKTYYCLGQLESDRVMIVSEGGNILHLIGESGILPGQFDTPIAIAACILPKFLESASKFSSEMPTPGWYLGQIPADQLIQFMNRRDQHFPRNFRICQRPRVPHIFDVVYISSSGILVNCQIQKDRATGEAAMITSTGTKLKSYPSIDHIVRNFSEFYKVPLPFPSSAPLTLSYPPLPPSLSMLSASLIPVPMSPLLLWIPRTNECKSSITSGLSRLSIAKRCG
jgi:hypothetical protein